MTKIRKAGTIERFIEIMGGEVGYDTLGESVGKSGSAVRKYSDPDDYAHVAKFNQFLEMCVYYARETGEHSPLVKTLMAREEQAMEGINAEAAEIVTSALDLQHHVGVFADTVNRALSPDSEHGRHFSDREENCVIDCLENVKKCADIGIIAVTQNKQPA